MIPAAGALLVSTDMVLPASDRSADWEKLKSVILLANIIGFFGKLLVVYFLLCRDIVSASV